MPITLQLTGKTTSCNSCLCAVVAAVDQLLRGASQVVVINNPLSGCLIIASLFIPSVSVGAHGVLGLVGATAAAALMRLDAQALASGLFGYNGLLVGMALPTFLVVPTDNGGWDARIAVACVVMGAMSTLLQLALGNVLVPTFRTPPFTLAFNATFLLFLLASAQWSTFRLPHHDDAAKPAPRAAAVEVPPSIDAAWLLLSSLVSIGQIFLCESATSGLLILSGMAISSRIAAVAAYSGALLANALALGLGAEVAAIGSGLWGYSSALTAIAVATFFTPTVSSAWMGSAGVGLTVLLDGALRSVFGLLHMPIGTLPFCLAALTLLLTHSKIAHNASPVTLRMPSGAASSPGGRSLSALGVSSSREGSRHGRREYEPSLQSLIAVHEQENALEDHPGLGGDNDVEEGNGATGMKSGKGKEGRI